MDKKKLNFNNVQFVGEDKTEPVAHSNRAPQPQEEQTTPTDMDRFVSGTGDKTTIFGVPYGTFKRLKPEHKQYYYNKAVKAEKLAQAKDIEGRATKESEDAYNRLESRQESSREENPILTALSNGAGEMAGFATPYQAVADPVIAASSAALNKVQEAREVIATSDRKDNTSTSKELGRGLVAAAKKLSTWDFGATDVSDNKALLFAAQKKQRGEQTTPSEDNLLESAALTAAVHGDFDKDTSFAYNAGEGLAQAASYMKDFLITGGLQGLGRAAVERFGVDAAKKTIAQIAKNAALRAGGDLVGAAGMAATVHAGQTAADALDRMTGDVIPTFDKEGNAQFDKTERAESGGKALAKAFGNTVIEDYSEMFGEYFSPINKLMGKTAGKVADKIGLKKVHEAIASIPSSDWGKAYNHFTEQTHWNGFTGEYGEELVGTAMNAAFIGDQKFSDLIDPQQQKETFLSVALMSGVMGGANIAGYRTPKYLAKQNLKTADQNAYSKFGEEWNQLRLQVENADDEGKVSVMNNILSDKDLSPEKKNAFTEYVARLQAYHGTNIADAKRKIEGEVPEDQLQLENSYDQGTNLIDPAERKAAKDELDSVVSNLSEEEVSLLNSYNSAEDYYLDSLISEEEETPFVTSDTAFNYFNAKAKYDGMIDSVRDNIESQVKESDQAISDRTHEDGNIYEIRLKTDDNTPYYIVKGNISIDPDTQLIDANSSDDKVILRNAEGQLEMRPIRDIEKLYNQDSAEQLRVTTAQTIREQESEKAANEIEGVRDFAQDEVITINTPEGLKEVVVSGLTPEGNYEVVSIDNLPIINGEVATVLDKKQLSQMENEAKKVQTADQSEEAVTPLVADTNLEGTAAEQISNTPIETGSNVSEVQSENESTPPVEQNNLSNEEQPVPLDEDGEPIFHQMPVEQSASLLSELDPEDSFLIIDNNINALSKEVDKLSKTKPKSTSFNKIKAEREEIKGRLAEAQQKLDYWNNLKEVITKPVAPVNPAMEISKGGLEARKEETAKAVEENNSKTGTIKQKFDSAPKVEGLQDEIILANGEKMKGRYILTEAEAVTPSHNPVAGYAKSEGFPVDENGRTVNDRDYENDKQAQLQVEQKAQKYDSRAIQNPVIVSNDGIVLSGNDRTMAGQIAANNGTDQSYKEYARTYSNKYGFTPEQVDGLKNPRILFVPDEQLPYNAETFAKFNADDKKTQNKTEQAVKAGKIINEQTVSKAATILDGFESLPEFYSDTQASKEMLHLLLNDGIIGQNEVAEMMDGESFSSIGKDFIENALIGSVLDESAVRKAMQMKDLRQVVVKSLTQIAQNKKFGEFSFENEITDAINLLYDARKAGVKTGQTIDDYMRQGNLFGENALDLYGATVQMLANALNKGQLFFKRTLSAYNNQAEQAASGQTDLFKGDVRSKDEIINDVLNILGYEQGTRTTESTKQPERGRSENETGNVTQINEGAGTTDSTEEQGTGTEELNQHEKEAIAEVQALTKSEEHAAIEKEAEKVNTNPSEAQKEAGNYKMGHIKVQGFDITIENPQGSERSGTDADGNEWSITMNNHYGYFKGTKGKDGDHIDTFIGDNLDSDKVYVVDQVNKDSSFDEHKVMLGFNTIEEAKAAYLSNYEEGWQGLGGITETSVDNFRKWTDTDTRKIKPFADYKEVKESSTPTLSQEQKDAISFITGNQEESNKKELESQEKSVPLNQERTSKVERKIVSEERYSELQKRMKEKLNSLNAGFDPEILSIGIEMAAYHIEGGARKFADFASNMINDLGDKIRPYLKGAYKGAKEMPGMEDLASSMDSDEFINNFDIKNFNPQEYAQRNTESLERNSEELSGSEQRNTGNNISDSSEEQQAVRQPLEEDRGLFAGESEDIRGNNTGLDDSSNSPQVDKKLRDGEPSLFGSDTYNGNDGRGNDDSNERHNSARQEQAGVAEESRRDLSIDELTTKQKAIRKADIKLSDPKSIAETLPILQKEQRSDVLKAENRFFTGAGEKKETGKGMLFTNGTGTGKTFTGIGIIKRFILQGKKNILIVTPNQKICKDWIDTASMFFGEDFSLLKDTNDKGEGVNVTTYSNFRANEKLKDRKFDLLVYDESHYLNQNASGKPTSAQARNEELGISVNRAIQLAEEEKFGPRPPYPEKETPDDVAKEMLQLRNEYDSKVREVRSEIKERAKEIYAERPNILFLSATPFAYHKSLTYADGSLFTINQTFEEDNSSRGYNEPDRWDRFMIDNFGYRMRYNKLTTPDNAAQASRLERMFHEKFVKEGSVSGRSINVSFDYSRNFLTVKSGIGQKIDEGIDAIFKDERVRILSNVVDKKWSYVKKCQFLEAVKAEGIINHIDVLLKDGKKIVVFHNFMKENKENPLHFEKIDSNSYMNEAQYARLEMLEKKFQSESSEMTDDEIDEYEYLDGLKSNVSVLSAIEGREEEYNKAVDIWNKEYPQYANMDFSEIQSPINMFTGKYGNKVAFFNGKVPKKQRMINVDSFNNDDSKTNIIVVQRQAGKEGISFHDRTGKHPRILVNLGLPTAPTDAIQIEGRIYRIGLQSNAAFEYPIISTSYERSAFANTIASRSKTAENLAMGSKARGLENSFITGYQDSQNVDDVDLNELGKGTKEQDLNNELLTPYKEAQALYTTNLKNQKSRDQREGKDYYATPEPIGYKMVEFLELNEGDSALEPSAGHGAIARFFPDDVKAKAIEPSRELHSRLSMNTSATTINDTFENHYIGNKYDGIAMNPPFGSAGKTAIEHVEKAFNHLKQNGRIVAIIPDGESTDKKLEKFLYGKNQKGEFNYPDAALVASIKLPGIAFERAGTGVNTRIVVIDKRSDDNVRHSENIDLSGAKTINELFDRMENLQVPEKNRQADNAEGIISPKVEESVDKSIEDIRNSKGLVSDVEERKHTKTGEPVFVVPTSKRVSTEEYRDMLNTAKENKGFWSTFSKGFQFKNKEDAIKFRDSINFPDDDEQDLRFRGQESYIDSVNERFNNELQQQIDNTLPKSHIYQLGKPSDILISAGIPDLPIELASKRLERKSNQDNHTFDLKDIINLPYAIQNPIAIFNSKTQIGSKVILTELSNGNKNYIVAIKAVNKLVSGERRLEVNEIKSLYPKDTKQVIKWISQDNLLNWVDKEKADKFLNIPQSNSEDDTQASNSLSSATKIIQNFENPTLRDGEIVSSIEDLTDQLNTKVKIVRSLDEITDENKTKENLKRNSKGWFDPKTGEVVILLPNAKSVEDAKRTILHEVVAHKGLRNMFGKEFDSFLGQVYDNATPEIRKKINSMAAKHGWNINVATEEYLASLSEKGFEDKQEQTLWGKIKQAFMDMIHKAKVNLGYNISDEDLRYILWKSYQKLNNDSPILKNAADIAMKDKLFRNTEKDSNLAPNGKLSNLLPKQYKAVRTPEFKKWFGDWENDNKNASKVVDKNGEPIVVYRGHESSQNAWSTNLNTPTFTTSRNAAKIYSEDYENGMITEAFINSKKPLNIGDEGGAITLDELKQLLPKDVFETVASSGNWVYDGDFFNYDEAPKGAYTESFYIADNKDFIDWAKSKGYDSVQYKGFFSDGENLNEDFLHEIRPFNSNQIKSATNNNGDFNSENNDILFRSNEPVTPENLIQTYDDKFKKKILGVNVHKFKEAYQDSMLALKDLQDLISKSTGKEIKDHENAYIAENQLSSKGAAESEFYKDNYFKPMIKAINALTKKGKAYKDIIDYMVAKHGLERNEIMAKRDADKWAEDAIETVNKMALNGEIDSDQLHEMMNAISVQAEDKYNEFRQKDYSGLTQLTGSEDQYESVAQNIVDEFETDNENEVSELWDKINAATKQTLLKSYTSGLMSKSTYEKVRDMFKYYVPLRGWDDKIASDVYDYILSERSTFNAPVKSAQGRSSLADDPIAVIANMADSAILQGNRNLMKQKFLNMVLNHPNDLAMVRDMWYENKGTEENPVWAESFPDIKPDATPEEINEAIEAHEERMSELINKGMATKARNGLQVGYRTNAKERNEHIIVVKRGGKEQAIYINGNPRAAQAINGLTNPDSTDHKLMKTIQWINRQMAANFTTRNPAFVLTNMSRDLIFSTTAIDVKENGKYSRKFKKNVAKNLSQIAILMAKRHNGTLDTNKETERLFSEFIQNGGETGYTALKSVDDYKKIVSNELLKAKGKTDLGSIIGLEVGKITTPTTLGIVPAFRALAKWTEFGNRCAEDISRFSTYMTSRQMGRSVQQSINDAKEVTVNFNKKGAGGYMGATTIKSLFLFFNAAVQSLNNLCKLAKKSPIKFSGAIGSFTAAGLLVPLMNNLLMAAIGGDDDKDAYNNLPEWVRRNNLCLFVGNKKFITIPLPIELRAFYGIGEMAYQYSAGNMKHRNMGLEMLNQISGLIPLDPTGGSNSLIPDAVKPIAQVLKNKDFYDKPIYKKFDYNEFMPEYTKAYAGTSNWLIRSAELLNNETGGNKYKPGTINLNPAIAEHLFEGYFGGMAKTVNQTAKTIGMIWNDDERVVRNVPIVNRFVSSSSDERNAYSRINEEYYKYKNEYELTKQQVNGFNKEEKKGVFDYAKEVDFIHNSKEYQRFDIFKDHEKTIKSLQDDIKIASGEEKKQLEKMLNIEKTQLVEQMAETE